MKDPARAISRGGAVLAGGSSRRMGTNKAAIIIDGRTMLDRCLDAMCEAGLMPLAVVGGSPTATPRCPTRHLADDWPGEGPLGALVTALDHLETSMVVVLACDLLEPSADEISRICDLLGNHDAVVPVADGRDQWLHSVWRRDCRQPLRNAFEGGTRSIHAASAELNIRRVDASHTKPYRDADTPTDLP